MMKPSRSALLLLIALVSPAAIAQPQSGDAENWALEGVRFGTTPPRLRYCGQPVDRIAVEVHWDVRALDADHAVVFIDEVNGKQFAAGRAQGRQRTGEWVRNGTKFVLWLPGQERVAGEYTFRLLPCNVKEHPW